VDIIEKIAELGISGDTAAKEIYGRLQNISANNVSEMLSFEKGILDYACDKLELISFIEKAHLQRLNDDRNICAHPTFSEDGSQFSPSPELARAYIVQASNYLLIQVPVKGKVAIDRTYNVITEESFPQNEELAFDVLSSGNYLGRVRDSVIRNLTIILIKRLFLDNESIAKPMFNRISAALGAISRINGQAYKEVLKEKLSPMLVDAGDKKLKRIFPFLINRVEAWDNIEKADKIRIVVLIESMTVEELIKYNIPSLANINKDINPALQSRIGTLDQLAIRKFLESVPTSQVLKKYALNLFISSGSFDATYGIGTKILVPYCKYFNEEDVILLFDGIYKNSSWDINQILNAGGIDQILSELYIGTKSNINEHGKTWMEFWSNVKATGHDYPTLKTRFIEDKLLDEVVEDFDADNIPF